MEKINMNARNALTMGQRKKVEIFHAAQQAEKSTKAPRRVWHHYGCGAPAAEQRGHAPADGACITDTAAVAIDIAAGMYAVKAAKIAASKSGNPRLLEIVSQYRDILRLRAYLEHGDIDTPFQTLEEHTRHEGGISIQKMELEETLEAKEAMLSPLENVIGREMMELKQAAALALVELAVDGRLCNFADLHSLQVQKVVYPCLYAIIDGARGRVARWAELDAARDDGEGGTIAHNIPDSHAADDLRRAEMEMDISVIALEMGPSYDIAWRLRLQGYTLEEIATRLGVAGRTIRRMFKRLEAAARASLIG
ncbi:MAG: hypothetical protein LUD69_07790 [Oscillospiraceae bacterium]|nr:hypothetical protein [Oscillospiraceae bacterium]